MSDLLRQGRKHASTLAPGLPTVLRRRPRDHHPRIHHSRFVPIPAGSRAGSIFTFIAGCAPFYQQPTSSDAQRSWLAARPSSLPTTFSHTFGRDTHRQPPETHNTPTMTPIRAHCSGRLAQTLAQAPAYVFATPTRAHAHAPKHANTRTFAYAHVRTRAHTSKLVFIIINNTTCVCVCMYVL